MDLIKNYTNLSDSESDEHAELTKEVQPDVIVVDSEFHPSIVIDTLAPEVDITQMQLQVKQDELTRFQRETKIDTKQNHLSGFLQESKLDPAKFYEQFHSFENKGIALNPTDGAGITSAMYVGDGQKQEVSELSRKAKRK